MIMQTSDHRLARDRDVGNNRRVCLSIERLGVLFPAGRVLSVMGAFMLVAILVQPTPAAAFLDFLFGRPQAPAPSPGYSSTPLDVSVRPRRGARSQAARSHRHKRELGRGGSRHAAGSERKVVRQVAIDPTRNPDWYLTDPTLRDGDILILKTGPVVFKGSRKTRTSEDFVSLWQSKAVSSAGLRDIRMMVSGVWTPPATDVETPRKKSRRARR